MTTMGFLFWGVIILIISSGMWLDKKYKIKLPEKSLNQISNEAYINRNIDYTQSGGGPTQ